MRKKFPLRLAYAILGTAVLVAALVFIFWDSLTAKSSEKPASPASAPQVWMPGSPEAIDQTNKKMADERSARLNRPSTHSGVTAKAPDPVTPPKVEPAKEAAKPDAPAKAASRSGIQAEEKAPVAANSCKARIAELKEAIRNCGGDPEDLVKPPPSAAKTPSGVTKRGAKVPSAKFWAYITPGASHQHPLPCFANMSIATKVEKCSSMTFVPSEPGESYDAWSSRGRALR
jgi:hypothetical protein